MPQLLGIAPDFLVDDVAAATEYYRDKLGFTIPVIFSETRRSMRW